jgi:hypothetical protein
MQDRHALESAAVAAPIDGKGSLAIRASVLLRAMHTVEIRKVHRRVAIQTDDGANTAHAPPSIAAVSTAPDAVPSGAS